MSIYVLIEVWIFAIVELFGKFNSNTNQVIIDRLSIQHLLAFSGILIMGYLVLHFRSSLRRWNDSQLISKNVVSRISFSNFGCCRITKFTNYTPVFVVGKLILSVLLFVFVFLFDRLSFLQFFAEFLYSQKQKHRNCQKY